MNAKAKPRRGRAQQVARAGEFFVAAELSRRGAHAAVYVGNMPRIDLVASNVDQTRTASIQVKTRTAGSWHARTTDGRPSKKKRGETPAEIDALILKEKKKLPSTIPLKENISKMIQTIKTYKTARIELVRTKEAIQKELETVDEEEAAEKAYISYQQWKSLYFACYKKFEDFKIYLSKLRVIHQKFT